MVGGGLVSVGVRVAEGVLVGTVAVGVRVIVGVRVGEGVLVGTVAVGVRVMVGVRVIVGVLVGTVADGVRVIVGVRVTVGVLVGTVAVGVGVMEGVRVTVGESEAVTEAAGVSLGLGRSASCAGVSVACARFSPVGAGLASACGVSEKMAGGVIVATGSAPGRTGTTRTGRLQADRPKTKNTSKENLRIIC